MQWWHDACDHAWGDLLDGAFNGAQIVVDLTQTGDNHSTTTLSALDLPAKTKALFAEESKRVSDALAEGGRAMLCYPPREAFTEHSCQRIGSKPYDRAE